MDARLSSTDLQALSLWNSERIPHRDIKSCELRIPDCKKVVCASESGCRDFSAAPRRKGSVFHNSGNLFRRTARPASVGGAWSVQKPRPRSHRNPVFGNDRFQFRRRQSYGFPSRSGPILDPYRVCCTAAASGFSTREQLEISGVAGVLINASLARVCPVSCKRC
jgi:hypothetical protein